MYGTFYIFAVSSVLIFIDIAYTHTVGMGLMLATIWIRLGTSTDKINDRLSVL